MAGVAGEEAADEWGSAWSQHQSSIAALPTRSLNKADWYLVVTAARAQEIWVRIWQIVCFQISQESKLSRSVASLGR